MPIRASSIAHGDGDGIVMLCVRPPLTLTLVRRNPKFAGNPAPEPGGQTAARTLCSGSYAYLHS
jgi:hypothetical protein